MGKRTRSTRYLSITRLSNILGLSISDVLSGEEHKESLSIPDKIIIVLCLLMPIIIICFSLMISCFRTDYIFIGSIFLLIAYLLFIKKRNQSKIKKRSNLDTIYFIYCIFTINHILYKTNNRYNLSRIKYKI